MDPRRRVPRHQQSRAHHLHPLHRRGPDRDAPEVRHQDGLGPGQVALLLAGPRPGSNRGGDGVKGAGQRRLGVPPELPRGSSWMLSLEAMVNNMSQDYNPVHEDFRLWLTSMPAAIFPVLVLRTESSSQTSLPRVSEPT